MALTPEKLFQWAVKHTKLGPFDSLPTVRDAAKAFRCRQRAIIRACEDYSGDGYFEMNTAEAAHGFGFWELPEGQWELAAYREEKG